MADTLIKAIEVKEGKIAKFISPVTGKIEKILVAGEKFAEKEAGFIEGFFAKHFGHGTKAVSVPASALTTTTDATNTPFVAPVVVIEDAPVKS